MHAEVFDGLGGELLNRRGNSASTFMSSAIPLEQRDPSGASRSRALAMERFRRSAVLMERTLRWSGRRRARIAAPAHACDRTPAQECSRRR